MSTAYSELVDGVVLPRHLAGDPALELCNTAAGWGEPEQQDYLATYDHLVVWARKAGLIEADAADELRRAAAADPVGAEAALRRVKALREALYRVLAGRPSPRERDAVAAEAEEARRAATLVWRDGRAGWALGLDAGLALPVLTAAEAAADLLTSPRVEHVRRCPGPACGWLFVDPSGRRRWCTMATCGNRAKARRHAARLRAHG